EVGALLEAVVGEDPPARRDRAILELLYGTGLRISELVGLSLSDLVLDEGMLRAFGKGSKERLGPVGRRARPALVAGLGPARRGAVGPVGGWGGGGGRRGGALGGLGGGPAAAPRGPSSSPSAGAGSPGGEPGPSCAPPASASAGAPASAPTCSATPAPRTCWTT